MKLLITLLLLPTVVFTASAQDDDKVHVFPDVEASFPGGIDSMKAFLARTIVYPQEALDQRIEGKTYLTFVVAVDGTLRDVKVIRPLANCQACDLEAIRAVKLMPKWAPAQLNSKAVETNYTLPVKFTLPVNEKPLEKMPPPVYKYADEEPQFPGGKSALNMFLVDHLRYPQRAAELGITGKCYTQFIVSEDGTITNLVVKRGVPDCPECDEEAIRVIKLMPKWIPGKVNGKADKMIYNLPIPFNLQ
ncbi:MAG: energy transducer TonB [Bacteroidota bacterium]